MAADLPPPRRFRNPGGLSGWRTREEVQRMLHLSDRRPWTRPPPDGPYPPPPADVPAGCVAATFVGHATVLLRFPDGPTVLTDPMFSDRASPVAWAGPRRIRPPGIALEALPRVDLVLLSHNHYDHMDLPSLRALHARWRPRVLTGLGNAATLAREGVPGAVELDWWDTTDTPGGLRATFVPARHSSARGLADRDRTLWGGVVLHDAAGHRLYFAGDTGEGPHFAEIAARCGAPGAALLPIGAYAPFWVAAAAHLSPEEAVRAHLELGARTSVAIHWGTFRLTHEAIDAPVTLLAEARRAHGIAEDAFRVLGHGETALLAL